MIRPLVAGNWKMNGLTAQLREIETIRDRVGAGEAGRAMTAICPPFTLLAAAAKACQGSNLAIGAQDCHAKNSGAHTGDVSAAMIADCGAKYVIVGHSERRADHGESDAVVRAKARAVIEAGLSAIVCVGETRAERESGALKTIIGGQLAGSLDKQFDPKQVIVAYEPVWAIGTGLTPTPKDVEDVHAFIRETLKGVFGADGETLCILYGGSVKPANARELMAVANVNGALVGGASLKADDFLGIAAAYR